MLSRLKILPKTDEQAFLPAVLEVTETPPSPLARYTALSLCALILIAFVWSVLGHVDMVAVAQGQLMPTGRVKILQAPELAKITGILVKDGETVRAGEVLITLDATDAKADVARLERERAEASAEVARLKTLLVSTPENAAEISLPLDTPPDIAERQTALLYNLLAQHQAIIAGLKADMAQLEAEQKTLQTEAEKLDANLPLIRQKTEAHERLAAKGTLATLDAADQRQTLNTAEYDRRSIDSRLSELAAKYTSLQENMAQQEADFRARHTTELVDAEQKADAAYQELTKAKERLARHTIAAPIDGTVQQLAIHTVGGMVQEAQELLVVVPEEAALEAQAWIENKDIGFVEPGQEVVVKLETFPFTRYGFIVGKVMDVSRDAVTPPKVPGANSSAPKALDSSVPPQGAVYAAHIQLAKTTLNVDGRTVHLTPGMALSAEIKTGQRRIITYLLSPLQKHTQESLRER